MILVTHSVTQRRKSALNQTLGDWHRGALADRAMVARPSVPSVRTSCAENDDSGYPCGRASPHGGRVAPRPLWLLAAPAPAGAGCGGAHTQRDRCCTVLFPLQCLSGGQSVLGGHADL